MKADTATLIALLSSPSQYVIPIFQRYYSWHKSDWKSIWDEITNLLDSEQGDEVDPARCGGPQASPGTPGPRETQGQ
jgi:uncharacterized protein with ParB-like and HNH nuclease domain